MTEEEVLEFSSLTHLWAKHLERLERYVENIAFSFSFTSCSTLENSFTAYFWIEICGGECAFFIFLPICNCKFKKKWTVFR